MSRPCSKKKKEKPDATEEEHLRHPKDMKLAEFFSFYFSIILPTLKTYRPKSRTGKCRKCFPYQFFLEFFPFSRKTEAMPFDPFSRFA